MTGFVHDVYSIVGVGEIRLRERNGEETPSLCHVEERYRSEDNVRNEQGSQSERSKLGNARRLFFRCGSISVYANLEARLMQNLRRISQEHLPRHLLSTRVFNKLVILGTYIDLPVNICAISRGRLSRANDSIEKRRKARLKTQSA